RSAGRRRPGRLGPQCRRLPRRGQRRGRHHNPDRGPTNMNAVRHHRVETNGVTLHVAESGNGRPVVLLHGFPEFWYSWRHQLSALAAAGFRAVAPDLRGYNESDRPRGAANYVIEKLAGDVAGLARQLGGKIHLVGHDWGGAVA